MRFCSECGFEFQGKPKFCGNCGTVVRQNIEKKEEVKKPQEISKPVTKPQPKFDASNQLVAEVSSSVRVAPIYGVGFKPGVHCLNCGSKSSNARNCQVCGAEQ
jgi:hypothetical protein